MPALQLVNGILATLGPKHATAANQVGLHLIDSTTVKLLADSRFSVKPQRYHRHPVEK